MHVCVHAQVSFADLLTLFWTSHDPTQGMRQGNDAGTQVGSGVINSCAAPSTRLILLLMHSLTLACYHATVPLRHLLPDSRAEGYG